MKNWIVILFVTFIVLGQSARADVGYHEDERRNAGSSNSNDEHSEENYVNCYTDKPISGPLQNERIYHINIKGENGNECDWVYVNSYGGFEKVVEGSYATGKLLGYVHHPDEIYLLPVSTDLGDKDHKWLLFECDCNAYENRRLRTVDLKSGDERDLVVSSPTHSEIQTLGGRGTASTY